MNNDNRAYLEFAWDDQATDVTIVVFHEGQEHAIGMQVADMTLDRPETDVDKMVMLKELLIQVVEYL